MSAIAPLEASRFYAVTPERLRTLISKRIITAPAAVLAYVEMTARPGCPRAYSLEGIAEALGFGVDAVRRAVRRLLRERLLVGSFEGNRYQLAPAAYAFEGKPAKTMPSDQHERHANVPSTSRERLARPTRTWRISKVLKSHLTWRSCQVIPPRRLSRT